MNVLTKTDPWPEGRTLTEIVRGALGEVLMKGSYATHILLGPRERVQLESELALVGFVRTLRPDFESSPPILFNQRVVWTVEDGITLLSDLP